MTYVADIACVDIGQPNFSDLLLVELICFTINREKNCVPKLLGQDHLVEANNTMQLLQAGRRHISHSFENVEVKYVHFLALCTDGRTLLLVVRYWTRTDSRKEDADGEGGLEVRTRAWRRRGRVR